MLSSFGRVGGTGHQTRRIRARALPVAAAGLSLCLIHLFAGQNSGRPSAPFLDGNAESGLSIFVLRSGTPEKKYIMETMSAGLCLFDYDNDGLVDIYLVNGGTVEDFRRGTPSSLRNALFQNLGQRRFKNVTAEAGIGGNGYWGMGCSVADYDNDGWLDLYVTNYGSNVLYHNLGKGRFEDATRAAGADDVRWSTGSSWADFDKDGDLDLFVANYIELDRNNLPEPGSPDYGIMGSTTMGCQYMGFPVSCGPRGLPGAGDSLFVNQGDGTFREQSKAFGMDDPSGHYGLGAVWSDLDDDGYPDLYVANDTDINLLYHNRRDGTFEEIGLLSGAGVRETGAEQAGMGLAVGDFLNQGSLSILVTNFADDYCTLYRNEGKLNFTDVTETADLARPTLPFVSWGTFFFDYDNDGWLDLFVANGHVFPEADRIQNRMIERYRQRSLLFRNLGTGRFIESAESAGITPVRIGRGAAFADLDNDGGLDVVVNNLDESPSLFWNTPGAERKFLSLKLVGARSNRAAVGTRVRLRTADVWQTREVISGGSYLSQSDLRLHFGLGAAAQADEIVIRWPSGQTSRMSAVSANQFLTIREK
ncbi:MAG: CRTAC1 family protein [Acidobacteriota bacterium]